MARLIISAIWGLALLAGCSLAPNKTAEHPAYFQHACQGLELSCEHISPPNIVYTGLFPDNLYGAYLDGESQIYINSTLIGTEHESETLVHETVHYILYWTYGSKVDTCDGEFLARYIAKEWMDEEYTMEYDTDWRKIYGCEVEE